VVLALRYALGGQVHRDEADTAGRPVDAFGRSEQGFRRVRGDVERQRHWGSGLYAPKQWWSAPHVTPTEYRQP
jgi:hypothetical protein